MTNACVSHEMRNPINAITAMNVVNKRQIEDMRVLIEEKAPKSKTGVARFLQSLLAIHDQLSNCVKIQEDSLSMLTFIVQNMLDYA